MAGERSGNGWGRGSGCGGGGRSVGCRSGVREWGVGCGVWEWGVECGVWECEREGPVAALSSHAPLARRAAGDHPAVMRARTLPALQCTAMTLSGCALSHACCPNQVQDDRVHTDKRHN